MIDLSHLTGDERERILMVLNRDEELKKVDEKRVRQLEKQQDKERLRFLTGRWFYEALWLRYRDRSHGSDIIKASLMESAQFKSPSFVFQANEDIQLSPRSEPSSTYREANTIQPDSLQQPRVILPSPAKQRHNPFNNTSLDLDTLEESGSQMSITVEPLKSSEEELLEILKPDAYSGAPGSSQGAEVDQTPVPKKRTIIYMAQAFLPDCNGIFPGLVDGTEWHSVGVPQYSSSPQPGSAGAARENEDVTVVNLNKIRVRVSSSAIPANPASVVETAGKEVRQEPDLPNPENSALSNKMELKSNRSRGNDEGTGPGLFGVPGGQQATGGSGPKALEGAPLSAPQNVGVPRTWAGLDTVRRDVRASTFSSSVVINPELGEEEESVAKVLEWFSRSSDSSDDINKHMLVQEIDEAASAEDAQPLAKVSTESRDLIYLSKPGSPETPPPEMQAVILERRRSLEDEVLVPGGALEEPKIPEAKDECDLKAFGNEPVVVLQPFRSFLNTEKAYQPQQRISAAEIKLRHQKEREANALSKVVHEADEREVQQQVAQDEKSPPKIEMLKSFWEKGSNGPKILISRSKVDSSSEAKSKDPSQSAGMSSLAEDVRHIEDTRVSCPNAVIYESEEQSVDEPSGVDQVVEQTSLSISLVDTNSNSGPRPDVVSAATFEKNASLGGVNDSEMKNGNNSVVFSTEVCPASASPGDNSQAGRSKEEDLPSAASWSWYATSVQQTTPGPLFKQGLSPTENKPGKIGHLKSFWEKETFAPKIVSTSTEAEELRPNQPAVEAPLNSSLDSSSGDVGSARTPSGEPTEPTVSTWLHRKPNFTVLSMKERMDKLQGQSAVNSQFQSVRNFWRGAPPSGADPQSPSAENQLTGLKSPPFKVLESTDALQQKKQVPTQFINPNFYPQISPGDTRTSYTKPLYDEWSSTDTLPLRREIGEKEQPLSPTQLSKKQGSLEIGRGSVSVGGQPAVEIKADVMQSWSRGPEQATVSLLRSQEMSEEIRAGGRIHLKAASNSEDKDFHAQQAGRKGSGNSNERANDFRQAASTYVENLKEEEHQGLPGSVKKRHDGNHSGRHNGRRMAGSSEDTEVQQPLARSIISRDYQHYLGIVDQEDVEKVRASGQKEEWNSERMLLDSEISMRPQTPKADEGQLSWSADGNFGTPVSDPLSQSSTHSPWGSDDQSPVMTALRRASSRPIKSYKSLEDITSLPTGEEGKKRPPRSRPSPVGVPPEASVPSRSFEDPDQIKKMSKSVPNFLQKESDDTEEEGSASGTSLSSSSQRTGSSLTNLSHSSGLTSVSTMSHSVASLYSEDLDIVEVRGTIQFSINYVQKLKEFHIFVVQCRELAVADIKRNRSNPYVKSYLLPDRSKAGKRKTSVKRKTLNPIFNEILRYRVTMATLQTQTLNLSVWHNDPFRRNSFLGEVDVDLSAWDFQNTHLNDFPLKPRITSSLQPSDYRGEMTLAVRFLPQLSHTIRAATTGEVHVWVKDCKNLPVIRGSAVDPYVKCFVLPDTSRKSRQKTRVLKRTSSPVFNHTMVYDGFRPDDLPEACVELTVWDRDRLTNYFLGGLRLGLGTGKSYGEAVDWMDSNAEERALWEQMMASPSEWVEGSLPLRMLTKAKNVWK